MLRRIISPVFLVIVLGLWPTTVAASTPDWLRAVAQQPQKHYADDVDAVVLLNERTITVKDNGEIVKRNRMAYRILRPAGRRVATEEVNFDNETKITYLKGWSITIKGQEYEAKEKDAFERSSSTYEIFSDDKQKILAVPGADVGTVVGFEYEQKERPYLFQNMWPFQWGLPIERARFILQLPSSWEFKASWENHPEIAPVSQNGAYIWELNDVPRIENEYNRPHAMALAGRMLITYFSERAKNQTFKDWNELGAWQAQLIASSSDSNPALQQKVMELAPSSLPVLDRIKALARFAQHDVRYAAIEIGIGGMKPHAASEILAHRYGDCKDKAMLLHTMLAQIGVKSYYMLVHATRGIFTENTPPNAYFNHAILAIQLPDSSYTKKFPAVYEHAKLGHLLIFDPTSDLVPFGDIPYYEQDNYALMVKENGGDYIHLPVSKPEMNELRRTAKLKLLPDGTLQGEIEEVRSGWHAHLERRFLQNETQNDRKKLIEHFLGRAMGNFQVDKFEVVNSDDIDKDLILRYTFKADHYAKNAGPLLLLRPRIVGEKADYFDPTKPRHYAYEFPVPFLDTDSVEITLPDGFKIDELPEPAKAAFSFAQYNSKTEADGNVLKYSRQYKMAATEVPLDSMDQLKKLFSQINVDEKNMAVLKRPN